MKLLFDTSIWIDHLRVGALVDVIPALRGRFSLSMESVAAAELMAGSRSKRERRVIAKLLAPFERAGRVLHPQPADFQRAATAISRLREKGRTLKNPGAALLDGLIASVACREGALLVTSNRGDFEALASKMPLHWQLFSDFSDGMSS